MNYNYNNYYYYINLIIEGICSYIPETKHVSRVYSVAAILQSQSTLHVMLFPMLKVL